MPRTGEVALLVLTLLVIASPFLWMVGVPVLEVVAAVGFWLALWVVISAVGRRYEH